jgi:hypothetical protein
MKTSSVILLGVVGVGAVGAYMYMKNKQAQNALLGALPTTNQLGGFASTPTTTTTTTTTPTGGATTPPLSTTSDGVSPSDANLNLANATVLVADRKSLVTATKKSCLSQPTLSSGGFVSGTIMSAAAISASCQASRELAKKQLVELDAKLAKLGYKVDATNSLVRI